MIGCNYRYATLAGLSNSSVPSYGEMTATPQRRRSVPFCSRCVGLIGSATLYRVRGLADWAVMTKVRDDHCKKCGHAVFWGRQFDEIPKTKPRREVAR